MKIDFHLSVVVLVALLSSKVSEMKVIFHFAASDAAKGDLPTRLAS